ncbi:hypothetical protein [Pseudomonas sp. NPDC087029]|uniref:hypothetical protein n=1 Tax=Pseudomonas sp. NPDC087029 TaxID=3364433 RepID=UPI0037F4B010
MTNSPSTEQFTRLAKAGPLLREKFGRILHERFKTLESSLSDEQDIMALVDFCVESLSEEGEAALGDDGRACLDWLIAEPAFELSIKTLGYRPSSHDRWGEYFSNEIRRGLRNGNFTSSKAFSYASHASRYLRNVSSIAGAIGGYVSGAQHRAVLDGPVTIRRMKDLLLEFDQLVDVDWLPEVLREQLRYAVNTRSAMRYLSGPDILERPSSRRNDADLPVRLLASELLRINYEFHRSFHKRAVFHLMGLSIIQKPLEMRTIERLAKIEMDAIREDVARRIADRRGLDFGQVLTTLKANKTLTFQP